jgi:site-specific recombinase XerD
VSRSIRAEQQIEVPPYHPHLETFLSFLKKERGFADATLVNRKRSLKPFLAWLVGRGVPLSTVSPVVITKYFTRTVAGRWKRTSVSFHVQSLRSFFRYASCQGWCAAGIAESIDAPRLYTHENLPQGPSWEEVKKLVTSVNGPSSVQIRSRCAILLCAVYGLRVGEVSRLHLDDIDWAEERISVRRSKQRKAQTYPLTTEVGNALLRYLKEARPRCAHREVLLTLRRPYRPVSVGALSTMTQKLQKRLGMKLKRYGSHVLRHACATHLLAQGLTLKEVGDHLGHVSVAATRIYAKVDLMGLREVASLDVRPLVDCIEQCEQIAAPFYRIGEIQALRDVGNLGLGGVA